MGDPMELLYLIPGDGMPEDELKRRAETGNTIIRPGSTFHTEEVGEGPLSIESSIEEYMSIGPMLKRLIQIRNENKYDAIIIGCAGDPGLAAAREMMDMPIIGPAESSYHLACMIADRFSVLAPLQAGVESEAGVRVRIREMGLESRFASVEFVEMPIAQMWGSGGDGLVEEMSAGVEKASSKGAGCLVLGCMSMAFKMADEVIQKPAIPIVNPLKAAIKTAEMFVDLKLRHSRLTYPAADFDKLMDTVFKK
ncbi:MAG: aspartate/glutamate racemase family protein [Promethearchaeota archaeon]